MSKTAALPHVPRPLPALPDRPSSSLAYLSAEPLVTTVFLRAFTPVGICVPTSLGTAQGQGLSSAVSPVGPTGHQVHPLAKPGKRLPN